MGMYDEMLTAQLNTIIELCQHMRKLLTLLEAYADMDAEEKFLADVEKRHDITPEEGTDD